MKSVFLLPFVLATTLLAEDSVSNAELSRKLDLILGKSWTRRTRRRIGKSQLGSEKRDASRAKNGDRGQNRLSILGLARRRRGKKKSFMAKLRLPKSEEAKAAGAWTKEETTWTGICGET